MFQKRLNELIELNNLLQKDLADYVGYTVQAISRWCRGETEPDLQTLVKIANFFNVSIDYLLGNEKNEQPQNFKKEILKNVLIRAGYMDKNEELSEKEFKKIIEFIKINKEYIKAVK